MISKTKKADAARNGRDASVEAVEQARGRLAAAMEPDVQRGVLTISGERYVLLRPEIVANIQRQLEQTVGASTKGILYLAGERSAEERLHILRAFVPEEDPFRDFERGMERMIEAIALTGWGRYRILSFDEEAGTSRIALENSPFADAYGPSPRPVCHFIAGGLAGIGGRLWSRTLLCEEVACKAQGHARCEFELAPMPARMR